MARQQVLSIKGETGAAALAGKIEAQITNSSWDSSGGLGSTANIGTSTIIICQTELHHREIEKMFAKELVLMKAPADGAEELAPTKGKDPLAKMRMALRRLVTADYAETPFVEMAAHIGKVNQFEVVLDHKAFEEAAINKETPVSISFKDLPLESVLTLTMDLLGIAWTVENDKVLLTAPKVARPITVVYDVRNLAPAADEKVLSAALMRTVQPASWKESGGQKKIVAGEGDLSITQTVQVHRTIETWLADIRTALKPGGK